jgi:hypothetical protein
MYALLYIDFALPFNGPEAFPDATRTIGLLIRWLCDVVESPPRRPPATARRPGAAAPEPKPTPEDRMDDYVYACFVFAYALDKVSTELHKSDTEDVLPCLYPLLSPGAQSAWDRLVTRHFVALPLCARAYLAASMLNIRVDEKENEAIRAISYELLAQIESREYTCSIGGGRRTDIGGELALTVLGYTGRYTGGDSKPLPIFSGQFPNTSRRLALIAYNKLLSAELNPANIEGCFKVSPAAGKSILHFIVYPCT